MLFSRAKTTLVEPANALPGRDTPIVDPQPHFVNGRRIVAPFPSGHEQIVVGLGCFWGAERLFWQTEGVWVTAVGYAGGYTPNPTYEEVCSGKTGHTEVVLIDFDPAVISLDQVLQRFWEGHDPTQGMAQGNDVGTQYRSAVFPVDDAQREAAERSLAAFQDRLTAAGYGAITTEISPGRQFYYAEVEHQQYLHKNPDGYCPNHATGVRCGPRR